MRNLGIFLAVAAVILFSIQDWLVFHSQYFEQFQLDRPLHFGAAMLVALFAGWAIFSQRALTPARLLPWFMLIMAIVSFTVFVGVLWEMYEWQWDVWVALPYGAPVAQPDLEDTMEDLFFDLIGGIFGSALFVAFVRPRVRV